MWGNSALSPDPRVLSAFHLREVPATAGTALIYRTLVLRLPHTHPLNGETRNVRKGPRRTRGPGPQSPLALASDAQTPTCSCPEAIAPLCDQDRPLDACLICPESHICPLLSATGSPRWGPKRPLPWSSTAASSSIGRIVEMDSYKARDACCPSSRLTPAYKAIRARDPAPLLSLPCLLMFTGH